ncbi:MAG: C2H2-type zinc finger protein [Nitrososphaeraceae archaeon]
MSEKISCDTCKVQFNDGKDLGVHMREQHQKFYCGPCRKEMNSQQELKDHLKNDHGLNAENDL